MRSLCLILTWHYFLLSLRFVIECMLIVAFVEIRCAATRPSLLGVFRGIRRCPAAPTPAASHAFFPCLRANFPFRAGTLFPVRRAGLKHQQRAVARYAPSTPMPTTSRRTSCPGRTVVVRARPPHPHGTDPALTAAHSTPWRPPSPHGSLVRAARSPGSREHS